MITLKKIAQESGFSTPTVSEILNDKGVYSQETRKKVLAVARELGYRPNASARAIQSGRFNTITWLSSTHGSSRFMTSTLLDSMAKQIYFYLVQNTYVDVDGQITETYHEAKQEGQIANLPDDIQSYTPQILKLIDNVFCEAMLPEIADESKIKRNNLNKNFEKKEFQEIWQKINKKAIYTVHFETDELITKCIKEMDKNLNVSPLQYTIQSGKQIAESTQETLSKGEAFKIDQTQTITDKSSIQSKVKYDLIGKLAEQTKSFSIPTPIGNYNPD